jgi:hypothetical protein
MIPIYQVSGRKLKISYFFEQSKEFLLHFGAHPVRNERLLSVYAGSVSESVFPASNFESDPDSEQNQSAGYFGR